MSTGVPPPEVYFADDFEPTSLKVAQLRSILLEHSRALPSNAKKAELVNAFIDTVLPLKQSILRARKNVKSSAVGIQMMGEPNLGEPVAPVRRRQSRQSLAAQAQAEAAAEEDVDHEDQIEAPPKAKRTSRRSSAAASGSSLAVPGAGKTVRRSRSKEVLPDPPQQVQEESEPEEEPAPPPATIKEEAKSSKKHRESAKHPAFVDVDEKEGFSDYNPFQSGGESPDNKRDREKKIRRKSSLGIGATSSKRRQSEIPQTAATRATGGMSSSFSIPNLGGFRSPESSPANTPVKLDGVQTVGGSSFAKSRKSLPAGLTAKRFMPDMDSLQTPPREWKDAQRSASGKHDQPPAEEEDEVLMVEDSDEPSEDPNAGYVEHNRVVSNKLNDLDGSQGSDEKTSRSSPPPTSSALVKAKKSKTLPSSSALVKRTKAAVPSTVAKASVALPSVGALLTGLMYLTYWIFDSSSLGFCDPNANTNSIVLSRQASLASARLCIERHATGEEVGAYGSGESSCDASALPLTPSFVPWPSSCTACPNHGVCVAGTFVGCEKEYILKPSVVESVLGGVLGWQEGKDLLNGWPGLGSVAFPPQCVPDNEKRKLVGGMARAIEGQLARERGLRVCEAGAPRDGAEEVFGIDEVALRDEFLERKDPSFTLDQFLEIFRIAVNDLVEHGDIASGINADGQRWLAAQRGEMGLVCQARVGAKEAVDANKSKLGGLAALVTSLLAARSMLSKSSEERKKVAELVQVALAKLKEQQRLHYLDPVQAPDPFLAPAHLRDLVLAQEHSVAARQRLWKKVGAIVEGNANIGTSETEVRGEVHQVWEWKGAPLAA